jgi:hypothetical protein
MDTSDTPYTLGPHDPSCPAPTVPPPPPPPPRPRLRLKGLQALLQLSPVDARTLAARDPGLLAFRSAEIKARLEHLIERLKVGGGWRGEEARGGGRWQEGGGGRRGEEAGGDGRRREEAGVRRMRERRGARRWEGGGGGG